MSKAEVRSGAWRALARALRLSGTKNVQDLQVEPAQPVLDLDDLTRYGAGNLQPDLGRDYGWARVGLLLPIATATQAQANIEPWGGPRTPTDASWTFWIHEINAAVHASTPSEFEQLSIILNLALTATSSASARTVFVADTGVVRNVTAGVTRLELVNAINPQALPRPIPLHYGATGSALVTATRNAAVGATFDVYCGLYGRYLPTGMRP